MLKVPSSRLQKCLARLPCCLWKGPLKRDFSDIHLITFLRVHNFGNTLPLRVINFLTEFKI